MGANELRGLLGATPFRPFALLLDGGGRLEVRSPEGAVVFWGTAAVPPPLRGAGWGKVVVLGDIAGVEPLAEGPPPGAAGGGAKAAAAVSGFDPLGLPPGEEMPQPDAVADAGDE